MNTNVIASPDLSSVRSNPYELSNRQFREIASSHSHKSQRMLLAMTDN